MNFSFKQAKALKEAEKEIQAKLDTYRNERKVNQTVKMVKPYNRDDLFQK